MVADITQYPHTVEGETETLVTDPYQNDNGDWILPTPGEKQTISCQGRAVPNGNQNKVKGVDGQMINFDFLVYLPQDCPEFAEGQMITVKDGAKVVDQGTILRFFRGQMNAMLWA